MLIVCATLLAFFLEQEEASNLRSFCLVALYVVVTIVPMPAVRACLFVSFPDDDDSSFTRRALWYCMGVFKWGLEGLLVSVAIAVALGSVTVAFALRAVFEVSKGLRACLSRNLFWRFILLPTRWRWGVALAGLIVASCALGALLRSTGPVTLPIAAAVFTVTAPVFVFFTVESIVYLVMLLVFKVTDFALRAFSRVQLMSLVSSYDGSLAWRLGTISIEVENRSMAKLIQAEVNKNGNYIDGYDYQMIGERMNEVPRVGRKAVVMIDEDEETQQIASLSCSKVGHRAIH